MNYGTIQFGKVGTDDIVCEVPYVPAVANLVRARLDEAGNTSFGNDREALGCYIAFYTAELAGKKVCDLPNVDDIKPTDIFKAACEYDFIQNLPEGEGEEAEDEVDENPTATKGARS